jgi:hypothetical protein
MPTKYIILIAGGNERNNIPVKVLINWITKLENYRKLECMLQKLQEFKNGIEHYGINKRIQKNSLILVIMLCGFQRAINHT